MERKTTKKWDKFRSRFPLQWITLLFLIPSVPSAWGMDCQIKDSQELVGRWYYYKHIYQGRESDPAWNGLRMFMQFESDGTSYLEWSKPTLPETCGRKGVYRYENCILTDAVMCLDSKNSSSCQWDPDMTRGRVTESQVHLIGGELYLFLGLGDHPLTMVWKRVPVEDQPVRCESKPKAKQSSD